MTMREIKNKCRNNLHDWINVNIYKSPSGRISCLPCKKLRSKKWREANKEYIKQYAKETYPHIKEYVYNWQKRNPEKFKAYQKISAKRNKVTKNLQTRKYKAKKLNQLGDWFIKEKEWIDFLRYLQFDLCFYCDTFISDFHIEHKIPLSRGGLHSMENIVLSCPTCNLRKGTKTVEEFVQ